jgi:hypothetical protein
MKLVNSGIGDNLFLTSIKLFWEVRLGNSGVWFEQDLGLVILIKLSKWIKENS